MSDSDSASDSDISQGWTVVGPDGVVDSSDPDSDIIILKDEDEVRNQIGREPERDEPGSQNSDELDACGEDSAFKVTGQNVEPRIDGDVEPGQAAETWNVEPQHESETTSMEPGHRDKILSVESQCEEEIACCMEPDGEIASTSQPECKAENLTRRQEDECNARIEEAEEREDNCLLAKGADMNMEVAIGDGLAEEAGTSEHSMEWISSLDMKEANVEPDLVGETLRSVDPVLLSTSCQMPFHDFLTSSVKTQKPETDEGSVDKNDDGSDADASNDDTDDDDSDNDDESVVRKFHEATFHLNQRPGDRVEVQQNDEEDEVVPPDVDDRCESDISGVADDSDSDLSSLAGIDDLQLNTGEVVRTYRHQPNPTFNSLLTLVAVTTVLFVLGIGIGHYIGTTRGSSFHQQQILRLKTLQDEYFVCLRDTEKLESKLAKAIDSSPKEKIAAVMAVWRKKYEELVLERAELEYRLNQNQESVKVNQESGQGNVVDLEELKQKQGSERNQVAESKPLKGQEEEHEHRRGIEIDLTTAEKLHNGSVKNSSSLLHSEVVQCRQRMIALTADVRKKGVEMDQLRNDANQLTVENYELKAAILSQRYSEHPGNSEISATPGEDLMSLKATASEQNLTFPELKTPRETAPQDLAVGHSRSDSETLIGAHSWKKTDDIMPQPIVVSLIQFFLSYAGKTSEEDFPDNESLVALVNCFNTLENISADHSFYELLLRKTWNQLEELVKNVDLREAANSWELVVGSCREFIDIETSQSYIEVNKDSGSSPQNETSQKVNKLRAMMKKLDAAVKSTAKSMKALSSDSENATARQKAKNAIENWSRKMLSDWKKIDVSMFRMQGKDMFSDSKKKAHERLDSKTAAKNRGTLDQRSVGEKSKRAFEGNRDHKQTESSSSHQKYEEFWRWNQFDPDDFLQEGFFEDNQREWHKHQKRLRKISGRIQRLTEEILMSMDDDDDIEDIYEDVENFLEDMEDREIPEQLRTWLTCQARWWRSRVHRKHRNEDLVKGCGQQLVHWQLRVLCEKGGNSRRGDGGSSKFCKAVISSQVGGMERGKRTEQNRGVKHKNVGLGSNKISSCAGCSAGGPFQYATPKIPRNVQPRVNDDPRKVTSGNRLGSRVDYKARKNSRDIFATKNQTSKDHRAYDNREPSVSPWSQKGRRITENRYASNLAEGRHQLDWLRETFFHQPDGRRKSQVLEASKLPSLHESSGPDGKMPSCRGNDEFTSYLEKGKQYCKK